MQKLVVWVIVLLIAVLAIGAIVRFTSGGAIHGCITEISPNVSVKSIKFKNRYGMDITGRLFTSRDMNSVTKYPAIIVGAPYGGVKEQAPCVYANALAQRGFVVLTFDQSFMGESGGFPRNVSSPDIFVENFSAAVDFLGSVKMVDREKIGVIGVCGSGGFALSAAQTDTRIKAIATASMYDMSVAARLGMDDTQIAATKDKLSRQRWVDAENGTPEYIPFFPAKPIELNEIPEMDETSNEWFRFYAVKRGHHPSARGGFTTTSNMAMMNFDLLAHIDEIAPRPILFIVGDRAHSKFFSENAYKRVKSAAELYVVPDAEHIDLYDGGENHDKIPFDKIEEFFKSNLK